MSDGNASAAKRHLGITLSGPHVHRQALSSELRGVKGDEIARQRHAAKLGVPELDHSRGGHKGGCCGHDDPCVQASSHKELSDNTRREFYDKVWDDEEIDMDPGLAQCCIKDLEDSEKSRRYRATLARVDPIAKIEREHAISRETLGSRAGISAREWASRAAKLPTFHADRNVDKQEQQVDTHDRESELDSDSELDRLMNDFNPSLNDSKQSGSAAPGDRSGDKPNAPEPLTRCTSGEELATFLSSLQSDSLEIVALVLFGSEDAPELTAQLMQVLTLLSQEASQGWKLRCAAIESSEVGKSHPLVATSRWVRDKRFQLDAPPFIMAFGSPSLEILHGFSQHDLSRGAIGILQSWWSQYTLVFTVNNPKLAKLLSKKSADSDSDTEDVPASSYCNRPGCPRTFPHEHVTRLDKNEDVNF